MEEPYQGKWDLRKDRLACLCQRNGRDQERDLGYRSREKAQGLPELAGLDDLLVNK